MAGAPIINPFVMKTFVPEAGEGDLDIEWIGEIGTKLIEYRRGTARKWCDANGIALLCGGGEHTFVMVTHGDAGVKAKIVEMWSPI